MYVAIAIYALWHIHVARAIYALLAHTCRENDLRAPSGKFLRVKFCRPESFDFLCLWCIYDAYMMHACMMHIQMLHMPMLHTHCIYMMRKYMMHVHLINVNMMHVHMMIVYMIYLSMKHVWMMKVGIYGGCIYDAWICDACVWCTYLWSLILAHVYVMHTSIIPDDEKPAYLPKLSSARSCVSVAQWIATLPFHFTWTMMR